MAQPSAFDRMMNTSKSGNAFSSTSTSGLKKAAKKKRVASTESSDDAESGPERKKSKTTNKKTTNELEFFEDEKTGTLKTKPIVLKLDVDGQKMEKSKPSENQNQSVYDTTSDSDHAYIRLAPPLADVDQIGGLFSHPLDASLKNVYTHNMYRKDSRRGEPKATHSSASSRTHLDTTKPPLHSMNAIFDVIAQKLDTLNFRQACEPFQKQGLRVVTMCSGTESPLLAMDLIQDALNRRGDSSFHVEHLASAEIEPFKQAYIQRNFEPKILFRDVTEFGTKEEPHTAFGGTAKQPEDVHLLIAGSSCIDYSMLNNKRKGFDEVGQSKATMDGILAYVEKCTPAVVVLENVNTAPWPDIRDLWDRKGYFGVVIHLDTKDFYIPQTRNRGYMIAFNKKRATDIGLDLQVAASTMVKSMLALAQRASSPYSDFIYSDDDPELKLAKKAYSAISSTRDVVDWKACRLRYANYRVEHKLGIQRPMTHWKNGGKSQYLDYAWLGWSRLQRERIHDTLDIDYLHYLSKRHYDMTYKARVIELSQNVDRDQDGRHWGIIGCVTPTGMPFDTRRGGPIFGREALALQGLPIDELSLNNENSRQLQDLAGNAMSTTTVGCAIFSAILSSYENDASQQPPVRSMFENFQSLSISSTQSHKRTKASTALSIEEILNQPGAVDLESTELHFEHSRVTVTQLKFMAQSTLSLCGCDDSDGRSTRSFVICKQCHHTACTACAGNPIHQYMSLDKDEVGTCKESEEFARFVARSLPPILKINLLSDAKQSLLADLGTAYDYQDRVLKPDDPEPEPLNSDDAQQHLDAILAALNTTVYFQSAKQESSWRVIFESDNARLELHIFVDSVSAEAKNAFSNTESMRCLWLLFAKVSSDRPASSPVRDLLSHPIARMEPESEDLFRGGWQLWNPSMEYAYVEVQGAGSLQPSWEQKLGLQQDYFRDLEVFPTLCIREIENANEHLSPAALVVLRSLCGTYEWYKNCDAACGSLYGRTSADTPVTSPRFFFLDPKPHQDAYLDRMVFADTHHRLPYGLNRQIVAELAKSWRPFQLCADPDDGTPLPESVLCRLVNLWVDVDYVKFDTNSGKQNMNIWRSSDLSTEVVKCDRGTPVLVCTLPIGGIKQNLWKSGNDYPIPLVNRPGALKKFQSLIKRMSQELVLSGTRPLPLSADVECKSCAPTPPVLAWGNTRQGTGKRVILRPFEDSKEATKYEKALRDRPVPITANVHMHDSTAYLVVKLNLEAAIHRLQNKTPLAINSGTLQWHLVSNDGLEAPPKFPQITLHHDPTNLNLWPTGDAGYVNQQTALKPRLFQQRTLWTSQRKTLGWMLNVERGKSWQEWDAEIFTASALGIELRVEAYADVKVSGGIIADEVGAGKTTTSLALVARGLEATQQINPSTGPDIKNRRIVSKATLILVPANILRQWNGEISSCFGPGQLRVVILKSKANSWDNESLKNADIILAPWNIFSNDEYWQAVSDICCAPFVPKKAGRAFKEWLDGATDDLEAIIEHCGSNLDKDSFNRHRRQSKTTKANKYFRFQAFQEKNAQTKTKSELAKEAQKVMPGSATPDALQEDEKAARKEFDKLFAWKPAGAVPAILHFFEFERIIVDEFTYLDARTLIAIQGLRTKHPWMLSGTPPMNNAESINSMAMLLNTKVFGHDEADFQFSFKDSRIVSTNDKSYAEEFREQTEQRASSWVQQRNQRSEAFVGTLIRQNPAPAITAQKFEHFVVSSQSVLEMCIYDKSYQRIMGQSLRFGGAKTSSKTKLNSMSGFSQTLEQALSPEEALLSCHAYFLKDYMKNHTGKSDDQICYALISEQQQEVRDLVDAITIDLQEAFWYWLEGPAKVDTEQDNSHLVTFLHCILIGSFGDPFVCNLMNRLAAFARENPLQTILKNKGDRDVSGQKGSKDKKAPDFDEISDHDEDLGDEQTPKKKAKATKKTSASRKAKDQVVDRESEAKKVNLMGRRAELQSRATTLNEKAMLLVEQVQHLRLLQSIYTIIQDDTEMQCHACGDIMRMEDLMLLGNCGHLVCGYCLASDDFQGNDNSTCPTELCSASAQNCSTPAKSYAQTTSTMTAAHGSKIDTIIQTIDSLDDDDKVIIFVQFKAHKDQLIQALKAKGFNTFDGATESKVKQFQDAVGSERRILILEIDSTDSAGWNLQLANHVMFFASFLSKTQYDYEATMTQAVGRAHRFGQLKSVHVYNFLSARTIDVNIIQARRGGRLVKARSGN